VIQAWSRVAIASWVVVASATGAGLTSLVTTVEAGQRSGHTTLSLTVATDAEPACRRSEVVKAAHGAGADDTLPARHRKLISKRFRRRFGGLVFSAPRLSELSLVEIVGVIEAAHLNVPAPSRDHARAPPVSNQPA
jgi:hypothetical protein